MEQHLRQLDDQGYAVVRGVFAEDELRELRAAFANAQRKTNADPEAHETRYTVKDGANSDTWGVNHIFSPALYEEAFSRIFDNRRVMEMVHGAIGSRVRFWGGHALWDPQTAPYELYWHRDYGDHEAFQSEGRPTHVQFNVCLLPDSCFRLVPGTHRRALTDLEADQQSAKGFAPLPGEEVASCDAGDVLFMNAHTLHRGSCAIGTPRQTLHIALQPYDEPTGGHASWRFMRAEGYLDGLPPAVRELMRHAIEWDDAHPLSLVEMRRRARVRKQIMRHHASPHAAAPSGDTTSEPERRP